MTRPFIAGTAPMIDAAALARFLKAAQVAEPDSKAPVCRVCGCTDEDCRDCITRTREPCSWVEDGLCSACAEEGSHA